MSDCQHKHTLAASSEYGFDDGGQCVPVVSPLAPDDDAVEMDSRTDAHAAVLSLISLLTKDSTALQAGQRIHLIAYLTGVSDCKTSAELARKLNISPGRVSQISRALPLELHSLRQLKSRTAKARGIGR